ncbi:hypothetical protein P389DRAFT_165487 [Cystobasidium minutum MCA 4210]|uniref:uncharacterized protein n=1 Tax=Cystobasidium minutum MCA 4210 TaxID=1397322 RepID=UPI0034CF4EBB|eukprot:jgi/Rhomi1/165487/fgenesh1_kg.1_\
MATLAERAALAQARSQPKAEQRDQSSAPSAPIKLSKALQAEADYEGPIERIEVDGLAVLKILQHASSASISTNASGFLFGMALGPRLSVSNSFALPPNHLVPSNITTVSNVSSSSATNSDERTKAAKVASEREKEVDNAYRNAKNFIGSYVPRAKELNLDTEIVGGYFVAKDGMDLLKEGVLVDILVRYQFGLGTSGGAAAPGAKVGTAPLAGDANKYKSMTRLNRRGIALVYDASSSTASALSLKAYSLSPVFLRLFESSSSSAAHKFDYASLASAGLTPQTLLSTHPVTITSASALTAFLAANSEAQQLSVKEHEASFTSLSASDSLETNLRSLIGAMDSANASVQSLGYQGRAARFGQNAANIDNLNRLDSLRTMAVADGAAKSLAQEAGVDVVRAFAAKSSVI